MKEVVWAILRCGNRFLLVQRSFDDLEGGTWVPPGGKIDTCDKTYTHEVSRELHEEICIEAKRIKLLCHVHLDEYHVQVFLCDSWSGVPKPSCEDIIGVGWFTMAEIHSLGQSLAHFFTRTLMYISYLIQHYDHHPDECIEQWRDCGGNV